MNHAALANLAANYPIAKLELFGSAARGETAPQDYNFLVRFQPLEPLEHGRAYFALWHALEDYLGKKVDLLEIDVIDNPYFLAAIANERKVIYAL